MGQSRALPERVQPLLEHRRRHEADAHARQLGRLVLGGHAPLGQQPAARLPEFYGTVEDCLKEAEMIVFWSSDPDTTYGFQP